MKIEKRIGLTIAIVIAVLIIGLLGWRFWPQSASSVMSVSEDTITSFAAYGMLDSFEMGHCDLYSISHTGVVVKCFALI